MHVTVILAAGGRGRRVGAAVPKQLLTIGGRSILERSVGLFLDHPDVDELIVALPPEIVANPPAYLLTTTKPIRLVEGGVRRQDSVASAFAGVSPRSEIVVVHDAARPFTTAGLISRTIAAAAESGAALAALRASDTVKRAALGGPPASPMVAETLPREVIFLAQTPQAFRRHVLQAALALSRPDVDATDEASLAEQSGHAVRIVEGEPSNMKVTTADDLQRAEALAGAVSITGRAGTGYDLHRLVPGRPLIVGGVTIPAARGPLAHSDGDVACHAITDAILGAAGLGDIGRHFPDTDPKWKDASSIELLSQAAAIVRQGGFDVVNVDATVVLETPKIKAHIEAMRTALADALGVSPSCVSVKGKTNEGVDAVGRGEAIAAHAVALLRSRS